MVQKNQKLNINSMYKMDKQFFFNLLPPTNTLPNKTLTKTFTKAYTKKCIIQFIQKPTKNSTKKSRKTSLKATLSKLNDPNLTSLILKKFISHIMRDGKKSKVEKIFKKVLLYISLRRYNPIIVLVLAIINIMPLVEVRKVRRRGKSFQVPFPLKNSRQISKSVQILLNVAKNKKLFEKFLSEELIRSAFGLSKSIKTTIRLHSFAFRNRSSKNYRWF